MALTIKQTYKDQLCTRLEVTGLKDEVLFWKDDTEWRLYSYGARFVMSDERPDGTVTCYVEHSNSCD